MTCWSTVFPPTSPASPRFSTQFGGRGAVPLAGINEGQHDLSLKPDSDADAQDKLTRINKWYCEQMAYSPNGFGDPGTGPRRAC